MLIAQEESHDPEELRRLYEAVGWTAYTQDIEKLCRALGNSHVVLTARDTTGTLLGLARTISDGEHVCYVQDVLVDPGHHRQGVGRALVEATVERYAHCRVIVLSTQQESAEGGKRNHAFYRDMGFTAYEDAGVAGFARYRAAQNGS